MNQFQGFKKINYPNLSYFIDAVNVYGKNIDQLFWVLTYKLVSLFKDIY